VKDVVNEVLELLTPRTISSICRGEEAIMKLHATSPLAMIAATTTMMISEGVFMVEVAAEK
jgi:hypothetical protein